MKKLLILVASLAVIITLTVTGTIAYKAVKPPETQTASANSTVSSQIATLSEATATPEPIVIDIDQTIWQRNNTSVLSLDTSLSEFNPSSDNQQLLPSPGSDKIAGPLSGDALWGSEAAGGMDRIVTVTNTGNTGVYVRTVFAMENADNIVDRLVLLNYNTDDKVGTWQEIGDTTIDSKPFKLFSFTYKNVLNPGATTPPSLKQFVLKAKTTNEDVAGLGGEYEILIRSQATAAEGTWSDAANALNTVFGQITTNKHPWNTSTNTNNELAAVSE